MHSLIERVRAVLFNIEINDGESWSYEIEEIKSDLVRFRWCCWLHDTTADMPHSIAPQDGRWWYLSDDADESSLIRSAWLAYQTFMHHEMLERFRFKGQLVFNPHQEL